MRATIYEEAGDWMVVIEYSQKPPLNEMFYGGYFFAELYPKFHKPIPPHLVGFIADGKGERELEKLGYERISSFEFFSGREFAERLVEIIKRYRRELYEEEEIEHL